MTRLLPAALLLAAACRPEPPRLDSCADPLGGVWRDSGGRGFHVLDRGREVDVFPMWDTSAPDHGLPGARTPKPRFGAETAETPARSPVRILLTERSPAAVAGTVGVRVGRCQVSSRATLSNCRNGAVELGFEEEPAVNPLTCAPIDGAQPRRWINVPLRRE